MNTPLKRTASTSSVGEVALTCAEPGAWRFSLAVDPGEPQPC